MFFQIVFAGFLHPGPATDTLFDAVAKGISLSSFSLSSRLARYVFASPGDDFPEDKYRMAAIQFSNFKSHSCFSGVVEIQILVTDLINTRFIKVVYQLH